ncbi:MAG: damage-inducible protein DinB, partial [Acidobacteria bacterium]
MALKDALLAEFDPEMANTRKTLERVPEDMFGWKPHEKSGSMIWLATHVARL